MSERVRTRERFKLSLAVFVFLLKDPHILLILRNSTGWLDGHYSVPGGVKEPQETLVEAAIRETQEEVGITLKPEALQLVHTMHNFTTGQEWIGVFFLARQWDGEAAINEPHKHAELKWSTLHDLPENISPYVLQALEGYQEQLPYSQFGWDIPADADEEKYSYKNHRPAKKSE